MNISNDAGPANVKKILRHGLAIGRPTTRPAHTKGACQYSLGSIIQLDGETCMLISGMEEQDGPDLCVGNDGFIFKKLSDIKERNAIVLNRCDPAFVLPGTDEVCYLTKTPAIGCFIPLGDDRPNAGKGFILSTCVPYKCDRTDPLPGSIEYVEKIDIEWDGSKLTVGRPEFVGAGHLRATSLTGPVPHEDGFVALLSVTDGICPVKFDYEGGKWTAVKSGEVFAREYPGPSEASIRKCGDKYVAVIRSNKAVVPVYGSDDGFAYDLICEEWNHTVPRSLNQGTDGSLYLTTNTGPGMLRNPLICRPWNGSGFGEPFILHDENGIRSDDGDSVPFIDHAVSANVTLEGRKRHFIAYRVCDLKERTLYGFQHALRERMHKDGALAPLRETTGLYIAEFIYNDNM